MRKTYMYLILTVLFTLCLAACGGQPEVAITPRPEITTEAPLEANANLAADVTEESTAEVEITDAPETTSDATAAPVTEEAPVVAAADEATPPPDEPILTTVDVEALETLSPTFNEGVLTHLTAPTGDQVALISAEGDVIPVLDLPSGSRVAACHDEGENLSDRRYFAFYAGGQEAGTLYIMDGIHAPRAVGAIDYLACVMGTFQFSPDGGQFAYIGYVPSASRNEFPVGTLRVFDSADLSEQYRLENVVAFQLADHLTTVSFFTDEDGKADEAAVSEWDGERERELATILPTEERCRFSSASVAKAIGGMVAMVLGQRCDGQQQMQWQFYTIPAPFDGSITLVASDNQPGDYVSFARNNALFLSDAGDIAYFTVPDGVTANTVAVAAINFAADNDVRVAVDRQVLMPTFRGATNAEPRQSYDRSWLAFTMTSPNNDNNLYALDLVNTDNPPIIIRAGARNDLISSLAFTPDNASVIYTAGSANGGDNSVFALDLASGTAARVRRGNFGRALVVSHDGEHAVVNEWVSVQDGTQTRTYQALRLINLQTNTEITLFEDTDSPANARISAIPLGWRVGS